MARELRHVPALGDPDVGVTEGRPELARWAPSGLGLGVSGPVGQDDDLPHGGVHQARGDAVDLLTRVGVIQVKTVTNRPAVLVLFHGQVELVNVRLEHGVFESREQEEARVGVEGQSAHRRVAAVFDAALGRLGVEHSLHDLLNDTDHEDDTAEFGPLLDLVLEEEKEGV